MCYNGPSKVNKKIHTERRMPTPAKMTLEGENTCHVNMREDLRQSVPETYQANTCSDNVGEGIQDVDGRIKPFRPSFIGIPGPI
jgi:hypothetical protein